MNLRDGVPGFEAYSGFIITTTEQHIKLLFQARPIAFEYCDFQLIGELDLEDYIGTALLNITAGEDPKLEPNIPPIFGKGQHSVKLFAVEIETSKGSLLFVASNNSPGIFPHEARIVSNQLEYAMVI
ncbi:MAG: hypothetical protein AAF242_06155 [Bacteroidota bacterium]